MSESNRQWRARNPEKYRAHIAVATEVRAGRLTPEPCSECGAEKAAAHHDDYSRPLDVRWLCHQCHEDEHHPDRHIPEPNDVRDGRLADLRGRYTSQRKPYQRKPIVWPYCSHYYPAPKRDQHLETARRMRAEGSTYPEIATALGVSKGTVYKWLNPKNYK